MKFSNISRSKILLLLLSYNILTINNIIASSSSNSSPKNNNFFTKIPRLSPTGDRLFLHNPETLISGASIFDDFETFFYNQTLDHFNYRPESYSTFEQRYLVNSKYWNNNNKLGPIFAYLGAEEPIDQDIPTIGFLTDNAPSFKALIVFIEHRYYGKSIPFGSREEALSNASTLGYFNSAQALTDYANILLHIKSTYQAPNSPIIVIGGSYGGMLASWFRLKYPHIALGALASSAPILYFDDITPQNGYYSIVTKDFREASENCYETILKSWSQIDKVAALPNGLSILTNKFKTCSPLKNSSELKDYLGTIYATAAQYNSPPKYPVNIICEAIDHNHHNDDDILDKIFSGLSAYDPNKTCYVNPPKIPTETDQGWKWQTCSEMVIPIGIENDTMFEAYPFKVEDFIKDCKDSYGVPPRPHWVTSYYGGHDIKLILNRFGSNIIFSNGLRDPYSSGGVLENISDSILAIKTTNGSHCLDILGRKSSDPDWLLFNKIPRLGLTRDRLFLHNPETLPEVSISEDLETFFYNQTLDHFNYREESYTIFQQRYLVNSKYWGGPNAPIFAYLGAEASIDYDINDIGFINENAPHFKALIHRYYGKSVPFGSREEALKNGSSLGYFNSAQALADYAHILLHIKKTYKAQYSPIIVIGASYGGMLASWFRLKYPHIAHAALASSAPILYFDDITPQNAYFDIVSKDFREVSESCYQTIVKSWSEIDKVGAMVDGLSILSKKFNTCRPPTYPVNMVCGGIDSNSNSNATILDKIFSGLKAYFSNTNTTCYVNKPTNLTETDEGWSWQTCSEMVFPIGIGNNTMFESQPFDLQDYINDCKDYYGISPRPHWATTYYGGHGLGEHIRQHFGHQNNQRVSLFGYSSIRNK
ncbi:hypothetical protein G4B88_010034 [Cannabis sativa]|uniref:Lysosomal Pro-X carboxypeptidase n=1 Tax=Cannabis sativa TaxID=3483 RepID=A0A7J6E3Q5_CANSA|nr:hypothetical protein G4B88_010034 [Cannabis sativa]